MGINQCVISAGAGQTFQGIEISLLQFLLCFLLFVTKLIEDNMDKKINNSKTKHSTSESDSCFLIIFHKSYLTFDIVHTCCSAGGEKPERALTFTLLC